MINFWKLAYKEVKEQRDQLKAERVKLEVENEKLKQQLKETREFFVDIKMENEELKRKLKECDGE